MGNVIDFKKALEDKAWEEANNYEWPTNICAICEDEFEEDLIWTDGAAFFCEECAEAISFPERYGWTRIEEPEKNNK